MLIDLVKFTSYIGVGGGFAFLFVILSTLIHWLGIRSDLSALFTYFILIFPAYYTHKYFVFKPVAENDSLKKYVLVQLLGLIAAYYIPNIFAFFSIPFWISYIIVVIIVTITNYFLHFFWTFSDENP